MKQWTPVPTPKAAMEKAARRGNDATRKRRWESIRLEDLHELNRDEVRRLLKKVAESGTGSLTPEEMAVLDRFSPN